MLLRQRAAWERSIVDIRRTLYHREGQLSTQFLDGRVYVTLTVDRISIQTWRWLWSFGRQRGSGIGIVRG
jgi:hypothetical protein